MRQKCLPQPTAYKLYFPPCKKICGNHQRKNYAVICSIWLSMAPNTRMRWRSYDLILPLITSSAEHRCLHDFIFAIDYLLLQHIVIEFLYAVSVLVSFCHWFLRQTHCRKTPNFGSREASWSRVLYWLLIDLDMYPIQLLLVYRGKCNLLYYWEACSISIFCDLKLWI